MLGMPSMFNPFMSPMNPMMMPFGAPFLSRAVYPMQFGMGSPSPLSLITLDKRLYADDIEQLRTAGDVPPSLQPHLSAEEASNQNELSEQIATLEGIHPGEVRDFSHYVGQVIASGPLV